MAEAELLKRTKIDRRTAKAAFTRVLKALEHIIAKERPTDEVKETLDKVQGAFENLVNKHKDFSILDRANNEFDLLIHESLLILRYRPVLNSQQSSIPLVLL